MSIPAQLIGFMGYENGKRLLGKADVTLPDISFVTESMKGAGVPGEIDLPTIGLTQSMTVTINWRALIENNLSFSAPKAYHLTFMGSQQMVDETTGSLETKAINCVMKAYPKKLGLGKLDTGTSMGASGEFEVVYLKVSIAGKEILEIDKWNYIYKVNGTDYLAKVRQDMGLA